MSAAEDWNWVVTNSPVATSRTDDIWFFDAMSGWLVNSNGQIQKTTNGGRKWDPIDTIDPGSTAFPYLRCMGWANETIGWIGAVTQFSTGKEYLKILLHRTTDGGDTWEALDNLPEDSPAGICGIYVVNEQVVYGAGTNDPNLPGPGVIKTTNGGDSWQHIDMSAHADNLIDVYFQDENVGWVVGGKKDATCPVNRPGFETDPQYAQLRAVILKTTDGGATWENKAAATEGLDCGEWGWKIQFLDEKTGFISLENFTNAAILKTTDGGDNWSRHAIVDKFGELINVDLEGVGFISETSGWVGGWGERFEGLFNSLTVDGGTTWVAQNRVPGDPTSDDRMKINRYRFIGKPVETGYCCGAQVYKGASDVEDETVLVALAREPQPAGLNLSHVPYDSQGRVKVSYTLPEDASDVFVGIWNHFAFHVRTLVDHEAQSAGRQSVIWDGKDSAGDQRGGGMYICRMSVDGNVTESQTIRLPTGTQPKPGTRKQMATENNIDGEAPVSWETIKGYFTQTDVEHMKQVSAGWPQLMDLHQESSVLYYAAQIHASVASGRMPIGAPRWTEEMVKSFETWWKSMEPDAKLIG